MPAVVSDASVLISLGATGHFDLLKDFYQTVLIPNAVWQEITASPLPLPGSIEARQAKQGGWLRVETPRNRALVSSLAAGLDIGEAEAITLASELGTALLLIDESDGRAAARNLGLTVTGTLGILMRAKLCGRLFALKPVLNQLIQNQNFRLSRPLYEQALQQVGEQA
jgi:predicted nucleic acid-binding protein